MSRSKPFNYDFLHNLIILKIIFYVDNKIFLNHIKCNIIYWNERGKKKEQKD